MKTTHLIAAICAFVLSFFSSQMLRADPQSRPGMDTLAAMASSLQWQTGTINIKDGLAKINLTDDFHYLDSTEANKVLHDMWGNPSNPAILGMIFPRDKGPLDHGTWGVTVSYEGGGYVKDDDADKINYTEMLQKMQAEAREANPEREKEGYPAIEIVGWAAPPHYDKATHKLYWAKDLRFGGEQQDTLNYDIRILGRRGVLVLGAVSSMSSFSEIQEKVPELLAMVDFQTGNTYADFDPKVDKIAEYGLATLVAGGALAGAAKLGLLGLLWKYAIVAIIALKKFVIIAVFAVVAGAKQLWRKMTGKSSTPDHLLPPPGSS